MAAAETIRNFKRLGTLLSPRKGHARIRSAPRTHCISFPVNPDSPVRNSSLPFSASDQGLQNSHMRHPSVGNYASVSTSFEECDSVGDEEQSVRGSSHIDLNNQIGNYDYFYEGSVNNKFARGAFYCSTENAKSKNNHPNFKANYDNYSNNPQLLDVNQCVPSEINDKIKYNSSCFDLNQQAPSLDSTSEASNYVIPASSTKPLTLLCLPPIMAFTPSSADEAFSFAVNTQSATAVSPASLAVHPRVTNPPLTSLANDKLTTKNANKPSQRSTPVYEAAGHNHQASLSRQCEQVFSVNPHVEEKASCNKIQTSTPTHSSLLSCLSMEGNFLAECKLASEPQPQQVSISASMEANKRKCSSSADDSNLTKCGNSPSKCHCVKRRKLKKKSVVRVPAISDKIAEIPQDDHSWRKYGQKPIKGSPFPRGYYKCSGVKGCPAKKHVERALDDPSMLIITYKGEHVHSRPMMVEPL